MTSPANIELETARLALRRMSSNDAEFILRLLNEPSFVRYIGDKGVRTIDDARRYILSGPVESYNRHGFGLYVAELRDDRKPIGICGLLKREWLDDADIGFAFLPQYWSMGYAFEAALATVTHARDTFGLTRLLAITSPDNTASQRLLDKLGFRFERSLRAPGEEQKIAVFAL